MKTIIVNDPSKIPGTSLIDYASVDPLHTDQNRLFNRTDFSTIPGKMIADYFGSLNLPVFNTSTDIPIPIQVPITVVTGQELMFRFDKRNPEIWGDIEDMTQPMAVAFRNHVGRRMKSSINLERTSMRNALNAFEANTVATADDIAFIKTGIAP